MSPGLYLVTMHDVVKQVSMTLYPIPCRSAKQWSNTTLAHSDTTSPGAKATSESPQAPWPPQNYWQTRSLRTQYLWRQLWHCCHAPGRDVCFQGKVDKDTGNLCIFNWNNSPLAQTKLWAEDIRGDMFIFIIIIYASLVGKFGWPSAVELSPQVKCINKLLILFWRFSWSQMVQPRPTRVSVFNQVLVDCKPNRAGDFLCGGTLWKGVWCGQVMALKSLWTLTNMS